MASTQSALAVMARYVTISLTYIPSTRVSTQRDSARLSRQQYTHIRRFSLVLRSATMGSLCNILKKRVGRLKLWTSETSKRQRHRWSSPSTSMLTGFSASVCFAMRAIFTSSSITITSSWTALRCTFSLPT